MINRWKLFSIFAAILFSLTLGQITYFNTLAQSAPVTAPITSPVVSPTPIPIPAGSAVQLTYPVNGAVVQPGSRVTLQAIASSGAGVQRVVFHVNGSHVCTDYTSPYTCNWTVPQASGASYTLTAWIIDNAGRKNSSSVKVTSELPAKRVFITSTTYNGNLGGLTGADSKCQTQANTANLGGVWKVWLSDSNTSAASRLTHNSGPYKLLDGTILANNWTDLTNFNIQNPINVTELGTQTSGWYVWTYTQADGSSMAAQNPYHCHNWTTSGSAATNDLGMVGNNGYTDTGWTQTINMPCTGQYQSNTPSIHLYCFEQ